MGIEPTARAEIMPRRLPLLMILTQLAAPLAGADDRRPMVPDDLFRIEEVGEVAIAPDGSEAAVVIRAPVRPGRGHGRPLLLGGDRSDVFLARTGGGEPVRLTDGRGDSSGSWRPLWSPDGRYLAILSTRGGDNVRLHVWDRRTGEMSRPTGDGVDLWAAVEPATKAPFAWLDAHRLLVALVAPGASHVAFTLDRPAREGAAEAWAKAARGNEPTASAVDSGPVRPSPGPPTGRLALVDVGSGAVSTVAEGNVIEALASPDGGRVAVVVEAGRYRPREGTPLTHFTDRSPSRLGVASLAGGPTSARWVGGIEPRTKIRRTQLTWAADGMTLAVFARAEGAGPEALYLVNAEGSARAAIGDDFHATATARAGGVLLALGRVGSGRREDWWAIDPMTATRGPTALTANLPAVPEAWQPAAKGSALAVASGKLWRLDPASGRCEEVPLGGDRKPTRAIRPSWPGSGVLVECRPATGAESGEFVAVDDGPVTSLAPPDPSARLVEAGPGGSSVFSAVTPEGTTVWTSPGAGRPSARAFALNGFLAEISDARFQAFEYRGADGRPHQAHMLLPAGHRDGDRHPTVVWVYPGSVVAGGREELLRKNARHPMNLVLLAARGYAVLVPSMPLGPEGKASDPLEELPKGVLPAVDEAVRLGLADPDRLAVLGHSYGGYAVYGLLTQNDRFRAGIAMAGITDLVALHGTLDARVRYRDDPIYNLFGPRWTEVGQGRMGASPWVDPDRYRRNSPITRVDRVRTPLLMIHGDADFVPITQAEEFYTALLRLGRRARLVRYWGEGHLPESPANVRDLWARIFGWLDENLGPARTPE